MWQGPGKIRIGHRPAGSLARSYRGKRSIPSAALSVDSD
jgi:hypothetical protein